MFTLGRIQVSVSIYSLYTIKGEDDFRRFRVFELYLDTGRVVYFRV